MGLEDKFYPEDGTYLTKFDNVMIKTAGKIGKLYQNITGKSYKDLVKKSYKTSAYGFGASIIGAHASGMILGLFSLQGIYNPQYESPLEEEIKNETIGYPRLMGKLCRISLLAVTPLVLYGTYKLFFNKERLSFGTWFGMGGLIEGAALIPYNFAEYLTKAQVPEPPKKGWAKKLKEKLAKLRPQKLPMPVPVQRYNLDDYLLNPNLLKE